MEINERMYQANIDLVDRNKLLEEDKKILQKRIEKATEYIDQLLENVISLGVEEERREYKRFEHTKEILQGRYVE